jgi:CHAD domain-containing protein
MYDVPRELVTMDSETREGYCPFIADALLERMKAMAGEIAGVRDPGDDIEHVHRMRVASRRVRSALSMFHV